MDPVGQAERSETRMILFDLFPNLTADNHEITSPKTIKYNCIAWAARNTDRWWQPGVYWPISSSREDLPEVIEGSDYGEVVQFMKRPD